MCFAWCIENSYKVLSRKASADYIKALHKTVNSTIVNSPLKSSHIFESVQSMFPLDELLLRANAALGLQVVNVTSVLHSKSLTLSAHFFGVIFMKYVTQFLLLA